MSPDSSDTGETEEEEEEGGEEGEEEVEGEEEGEEEVEREGRGGKKVEEDEESHQTDQKRLKEGFKEVTRRRAEGGTRNEGGQLNCERVLP